MMLVRIFSIFLVFTISSCGYFEKEHASKDKVENKLVFVGEVPALEKQKIEDISKKIQGRLNELKEFCKGAPDLQKVKSFTGKLRSLKNYAKQNYDNNTYSLNNVKIKDGAKDINLGVYLLDINSILEDSYAMKYTTIRSSTDLKFACKNLKDNYRLSYARHYNIADNVEAKDVMTSSFKTIDDSISCLCP